MIPMSLFPRLCLNLRLSLIHFLLSLFLTLNCRVNIPFKNPLEKISRSLKARTKFNSRSLFPLDCELKTVVATDSRSNSTSVSWWPERPDTWRTPVSRELVWPNKNETLLAAALRLLCLMLRNWHSFCTAGNHGDVVWAPAIWVVVGDVDRIVLQIRVIGDVGELGLITGTEWTWRSAMTSKTQDENARAGWLWMTRTQLHLEPRSAQCVLTRKCAVARFKKCILCTPPVAFSELRLTGRRILSWMFSWSILLRFPWTRLYFRNLFFLPSFPSWRPLVWAPPGCWRPLRRGRWGWEFTFFCEVLLPIFALPFQILANFRIEFVIESLSVFRWNVYNIHFSSRSTLNLDYRKYRFMVSWSFYQRHALQTFLFFHVDKPDCHICLVVQQALRERSQSVRSGRDTAQTHRSNKWLLVMFSFPNRFPIDPKYSQKFCLSSLQQLAAHHLLCDDAVATIEIHACNLSNSDEMHERKASWIHQKLS